MPLLASAMRSLKGVRVLPWANWSEWRELRDMVANGETKRACQRVELYRLRRRNAVPITMISTVVLMKQLEQPDPDPYLQRLALSMTLTRLVNGTTDQLQPRGESSIARSVYSLAVELKLPLILVEIRHQASHNALPRLSTLESAAKKALTWLREYYWDPQFKNINAIASDEIDAIRKVFDAGHDGQNNNFTGDKQQPADQSVAQRDNAESKGSLSVAEKLRVLADKIQDKDKAPRPNSSNTWAERRPQWKRCTDFESWKRTPLGLIPAQFRVPRIYDLKSSRHCHPRSMAGVGFSSVDRLPRTLGDASESSSEVDEHRGRKRPASPVQIPARSAKRTGRYTAEQEAYIAKKMAEYASLVSTVPPS